MAALPLRPIRSSSTRSRSLAGDIRALYEDTRARMGVADLQHIRRVAAYSKAIDARAEVLITTGRNPRAVGRGVALRGLHTLLEFSELGHNILHGSYDDLEHLDPGGPFHSERWDWDFVTDTREWRVMHHQNHHPHTGIVGRDHDIGYSIGRLMPGQNWYGHHALQPALLGIFVAHLYPFAIYTATSAARVEGRPVWTRATFRAAFQRIGAHVRRDYVERPRMAGLRAPQTLVGNYLGTVLGYDLAALILAIEHHAPNVELFPDPGPSESADAFYERQFSATTNFTDGGRLEQWFRGLLEQEVPFEDRPDFRVFYGGLDTHIEHHLFPDLPCQRQREVASDVRSIAAEYGIPYNELPLETLVPEVLRRFVTLAPPQGEGERISDVMRRPRRLLGRLRDGLLYRGAAQAASDAPYLQRPRFHDIDATVVGARPLAGGDAIAIELARPRGWDTLEWSAGAFVSVRVWVDGVAHTRQYSLLRDGADGANLEIAVRRVPDGVVSNHLADTTRVGSTLRLVGPPERGGLAVDRSPSRALYLAGGVGITPILSLLRLHAREAPTHSAVLLYFNRRRETTLFADTLAELASGEADLRVAHFVDEPAGAPGQGRLSSALLAAQVPDVAQRTVFLCGPAGFLEAARRHLRALGVPDVAIREERFTAAEATQTTTGRAHEVRLLRSGISLVADEGRTLLETARAAGIDLPAGCERGLCRACVCGKQRGTTADVADDRHTGRGRITLCNTYPRSAVTLDV